MRARALPLYHQVALINPVTEIVIITVAVGGQRAVCGEIEVEVAAMKEAEIGHPIRTTSNKKIEVLEGTIALAHLLYHQIVLIIPATGIMRSTVAVGGQRAV